MMHGGTLNLPCGTVVSARIGTVNRNELWDTGADKGHFARSTPPFARGADLSGNRYVIHRNPLALSRPQRPAGSSLLWEETIPAPRFRRGDWYARRENPVRGRKDTRAHAPPGSRLHDLCRLQSDDYQSSGGSATNVFNCAKVHQNIDQVATPPPRRHAGQPSNPPSFLPSGYQSHSMTRTRHPQMTVRFENCSDPVADKGGSAQIRVGRSPDLCYPWGSPSSTVSTTEHTETASRHTEDTEPKPPCPSIPLVPISSGESGLVKKPGQGRLDAFQCAWAVSPAARASHGNADLNRQVTGMQILTGGSWVLTGKSWARTGNVSASASSSSASSPCLRLPR